MLSKLRALGLDLNMEEGGVKMLPDFSPDAENYLAFTVYEKSEAILFIRVGIKPVAVFLLCLGGDMLGNFLFLASSLDHEEKFESS